MLTEVSGHVRNACTFEIFGCRARNHMGVHQLFNNEALRLLMLSAALTQASGADKNIDAFVSYLGGVIDTYEDEAHFRITVLKRGDGPQQHPTGKGWAHANFDLAVQCRISPKFVNRLFEVSQNLSTVSIETRSFGR